MFPIVPVVRATKFPQGAADSGRFLRKARFRAIGTATLLSGAAATLHEFAGVTNVRRADDGSLARLFKPYMQFDAADGRIFRNWDLAANHQPRFVPAQLTVFSHLSHDFDLLLVHTPSREVNMTRQRGRWMPALTMVAVLSAAGSSQAQELRRDDISNGVRIGAGTGAAAGVVLSLVTEEICSPGACAYLGAVAGGLIGLVVDKNIGRPRPVERGSFIDDGLGNGALMGALSGMGVVLFDFSLRCGPQPDRVPCTREDILKDIFLGARWMALVGLLIDAAIPSRLQGPESVLPERSTRRLGVGVNLRF